MVGVPGTEERLALAEVEDRLRRLRGRFNLYTLQHNTYLFGTALALGTGALIIGAFKLSEQSFAWIVWPLVLTLTAFLLSSLRRVVGDWTTLVTAARRADLKAGLQERVSTLAAQLQARTIDSLGNSPPSRLWPHLVADNTARLADWEITKVAPRRIPWSAMPFFAALLLALLIAGTALLSPATEDDPFTLDNMQRVAQDLPQRVEKLVEEQMSLIPRTENWGGSSIFSHEDQHQQAAAGASQNQAGQSLEEGDPVKTDNPVTQTLASLPQELQQTIRESLQGLQIPPNPEPQDQRGNQEAPSHTQPDQLALNTAHPSDNPDAKADFAVQTDRVPPGGKTRPAAEQSGAASDTPAMSGTQQNQVPAQGSGLQQLSQARLGRKNARGAFTPKAPQLPGQGGAGAGGRGAGAGSGTDPNLFGNPANLGTKSNTFNLSLDSTYELTRGGEGEPAKYEGELPPRKSRRRLSHQQSLDDAIRKAQIPPEYEAIVKRLFSGGGSR